MRGGEIYQIPVYHPLVKACSRPADVAPTEVAKGVYRLEGRDGSRLLCQYVIGGDGASLVVDAGLPETPDRAILPALRELTGDRDDPVTLVLTHPDSDHCGGTAQLRRSLRHLTVLAHEGDADLLGNPERTIAHRYRACWASDLVGPSDERLRSTRRRLGPAYELDRVIDVDVDVAVGGRRCSILHVPGHSPGHLAVWLPAERVAIVGDAAMGRGIPNLDGSLMFAPQYHSPERYLATIGRLTLLDPEVLLGAHFPPLRGSAVASFLADSEQAVRRIDAAVREALPFSADSTLAGLCGEVHRRYGDLRVGTEHELATTIAGTLAAMVARGEAVLVSAGPPRRWRATPEQRT